MAKAKKSRPQFPIAPEISDEKFHEYGLSHTEGERLISTLVKIIQICVRILAVLMTFIIFWGILDILWVIYQKFTTYPYFILNINDILATFGAFLAVLIAIEIFINITMYLRDDVIHVNLVLATALMAIARKVIILDFTKLSPSYVWATGVVIIALSVGFWLVTKKEKSEE